MDNQLLLIYNVFLICNTDPVYMRNTHPMWLDNKTHDHIGYKIYVDDYHDENDLYLVFYYNRYHTHSHKLEIY